MVTVFHEPGAKSDDAAAQRNFVEYGRRLETMLAELTAVEQRGASRQGPQQRE